jgi:hypothetical protein
MSLFIELVDRIRTWLELRAKYNSQQDERFDEALLAVHQAANRTRAYLADVRFDPDSRERDRENDLSNAWMRVGDCLRRLHDPDAEALYQRCFVKAEYWADPEVWKDGRLQEAGIGLDRLTNEITGYVHGHGIRRRRR